MSDAELVVGARNEAKAVLDEIGDQLAALAIPAQEGSLKVDAAISGVIAKLASGAVALTGAFGAAAIAFGSIAAGSSIKAINDESEALDALNRELDNYVGNGEVAEQAAKDFAVANRAALGKISEDTANSFANVNQAAKRISEDVAKSFAAFNRVSLGVPESETISLLTAASALGVTQDKLDEAALAAIGLSKALGVDVNAALKKVVDGDDRLVSMTESVNRGLQEQATSLDGLPKLWNTVEIASKQSIELLMSSTKPMQQAMGQLGEAITEGLTHSLVGAISAMEVYQENTAAVNEYVWTSWALAYEQMDATAKFFLTEQLPVYWEFAMNNAGSLITDGLNTVIAAFKGQFQAITEIIMAQVGYWNGSLTEQQATAALLEAIARPFDELELRAEKMPEVIGQRMTERERDLTDKLAAMGKKLGKEFSEAFDENLKKFSVEAPTLTESDLQGLRQNKPEDQKSGKSRQQELQAVESRLLTRGRVDNVMDKVAKATQESANRLRSIDENLRSTNVTNDTLKLEFVA